MRDIERERGMDMGGREERAMIRHEDERHGIMISSIRLRKK